MSIAELNWQATTVHDVVLGFLLAEQYKFPKLDARQTEALSDPDLLDTEQNNLRCTMLGSIRALLMARVPPNISWFKVEGMAVEHFGELHVIGRCGFDGTAGGVTALLDVCQRCRQENNTTASDPTSTVVLFGHTKEGPFTILEGNHRLCALAASGTNDPITFSVMIGLSDQPCFWHSVDPDDLVRI